VWNRGLVDVGLPGLAATECNRPGPGRPASSGGGLRMRRVGKKAARAVRRAEKTECGSDLLGWMGAG
jgi:hypothetical protein